MIHRDFECRNCYDLLSLRERKEGLCRACQLSESGVSDEAKHDVAKRMTMSDEIARDHGSARGKTEAEIDAIRNQYGLEAMLSWLVAADF